MSISYYKKLYHPEEWRQLLADKETQWRDGYSAKSLAYAWASGVPIGLQRIMQNAMKNDFQPIFAFPEYVVPIPGGNRGSQNDIFLLGLSGAELIVTMVEGKVKESFDKTISEKVLELDKGFENERLQFLAKLLEFDLKREQHIRYQLVHRLASVILEARRLGSRKGYLVIHSFAENNDHYADFEQFLAVFNLTAEANRLLAGRTFGGVHVDFIWYNEKVLS